MNPDTLTKYDKYTAINKLDELKARNNQLINYRNKITKLEHTIKLLKDDNIYLQKIIDRPTLKMKIMTQIDILLSHVGLKRIRRNK